MGAGVGGVKRAARFTLQATRFTLQAKKEKKKLQDAETRYPLPD